MSVAQRTKRSAGLSEGERATWIGAVLLFGVADLVTTVVGIAQYGAVEANPVVAPVVGAVGLWVLVPVKAVAFLGFWFLFASVPEDYRVGVPVGLTLLGTFAATWNAVLLVVAGGIA